MVASQSSNKHDVMKSLKAADHNSMVYQTPLKKVVVSQCERTIALL